MTVRATEPLDSSEKRALRAFRAAKKKLGAPPNLEAVAAELGCTYQNASLLLKRLVKKGRLEKVSRFYGFREVRREPGKKVA